MKKGKALPIKLWTLGFLQFFTLLRASPNPTLDRRAPQTADSPLPAGFPDPTAGLTDPCGKMELTPATWEKLQIDQYIADFPGIDKMNLTGFADALKVQNCFCGIGKWFMAGQVCYPLVGINWIIMVAIQNWNDWLNTIYQAIESAITAVREAASSIVSDFIPDQLGGEGLFGWGLANIVFGVLAIFAGPMIRLFRSSRLAIAGVEARGIVTLAGILEHAQETYNAARAAQAAGRMAEAAHDFNQMDSAIIARNILVPEAADHLKGAPVATTSPALQQALIARVAPSRTTLSKRRKRGLQKRGAPPSAYSYTRWAGLDVVVSGLQNQLQGILALSAQIALEAPFYSDRGMAALLLGGELLKPIPDITTFQESAMRLATLVALSEFFKSINMFITVSCDPCDDLGDYGAWTGNTVSYCSPEGVMMNMIQAFGPHARNEVKGKDLLFSKYHYNMKDLLQQAFDCQMKYGLYTEGKMPQPTNEHSECLFTLAVCDCTWGPVAGMIHQKKGVVTACREAGKLPI